MSETLESPVEEQKCASPRGLLFAAYVHTNTKAVNHPWMSCCLKIKTQKEINSTDFSTYCSWKLLLFMFVVNQGQNLNVTLAAANNLKLLSPKQILFSFPKTQENKTKLILFLRSENFQIMGFPDQLWKWQQVTDWGEADLYLRRCCSSRCGRRSAPPWCEPRSAQCPGAAPRQPGQPCSQHTCINSKPNTLYSSALDNTPTNSQEKGWTIKTTLQL